jgi:pyridoxal phosphate enzyme (YggS family)
MKNSVANRLLQVKQRISDAEYRFQRLPHSVRLIAITKSQDLEVIKAAIAAGQLALGESYLQEALAKVKCLRHQGIEWHFVGGIQANKAKSIAIHFSWVHSLSTLKTAIRLNHYRKEANLTPLNVCIQVNLQKEVNKLGVYLEDLIALAESINKLPYLHLRGLMAIPKPEIDFERQRENFKCLRLGLEKLTQLGLPLDILSMGMSDDFEAAIAEGANFIRIGSAIFGKRAII